MFILVLSVKTSPEQKLSASTGLAHAFACLVGILKMADKVVYAFKIFFSGLQQDYNRVYLKTDGPN